MSGCKKMFMTVAAVILSLPIPGNALTPPVPVDELRREADLIVRGEVIGIQCAPQGYEQSRCATWNWYVATLKVNTLKKGRWPGKLIPILFRDLRFVHGCIGDADHIHRVGERGFYYLVSRGDGNWAPVNFRSVDVKKAGDGPLPACR